MDEKIESKLQIKLIFYKIINSGKNSSSKKIFEPNFTAIENCFCVFTNRRLFVFQIVEQNLFDENIDYNKCLKVEFSIELNQIEIIEISMANHYITIKINQYGNNILNQLYLKMITIDIYKTQLFMNTLSSKLI